MSESKLRLDPRLAKLHKNVVFRLYETKIEPLLIANELMDSKKTTAISDDRRRTQFITQYNYHKYGCRLVKSRDKCPGRLRF